MAMRTDAGHTPTALHTRTVDTALGTAFGEDPAAVGEDTAPALPESTSLNP
jgi:hypothetical protein